MTAEEIKKRIRYLQTYQLSMARIGEDSEARDREEMRVVEALSRWHTLLKEVER